MVTVYSLNDDTDEIGVNRLRINDERELEYWDEDAPPLH